MCFALTKPMKTTIISNDSAFINIIKDLKIIPDNLLDIYNSDPDTLEIMSHTCTERPEILIMDDDYTKPESAHVLKAIRKVNKTIKIIFISSDSSVELGRLISPVGILYHAIKPVDIQEISQLFNSINKHNQY